MAEQRSARYELLDALRGIAILSVLLLHFSERGRESGDTLVHARLWPVLQHGYLGVQLFFVISGYCITAAVGASVGKPWPVWYFLTRRLRRIFPPYWAGIVLVVVSGLLTIALLKTPREVVFPLQAWEWIANVLLMQGPLQAKDANLVFWSLSIELQFYLMMAVCLLLKPRAAEVWLIFVSAVSFALSASHAVPLTGWVLNYWAEFACGIAAFFWITRRNQFAMTPLLLVAGSVAELIASVAEHESIMLADGRMIPGLRISFCLIVMLSMIGLYTFDSIIVRNRAIRWLMSVGVISYSLYLIHVPVGTRVFNLGQRLTGLQGPLWLVCFAASLFSTAIVGVLFFRWCERPWLNSSVANADRNRQVVPATALSKTGS